MSDIQTQKGEAAEVSKFKPESTPAPLAKQEQQLAPAWRKPLIIGALVLAFIGGGFFGLKAWSFGRSHVSTDDAYITGSIVSISSKVSGSVKRVFVKENQEVKTGDLLAELDPSTYLAEVRQAEANVAIAKAAVAGAASSVSMTSNKGGAQVEAAQGGVSQMTSMISGAAADVRRSEAAVLGVQAAFRSSKANVSSARAAVEATLSQRRKAVLGVQGARAQIATAQASVRVAQANVLTVQASLVAMQANLAKAEKDAKRYEELFAQDAISAQQLDSARAALSTAQAQVLAENEQVSASKEQVSQAKEIVLQRDSDLKSAQEQIKTADSSVSQARAQLKSAQEASLMSAAAISQAESQLASVQAGVAQAQAKKRIAIGQLHEADTTSQQNQVSQAEAKTAEARALQAQAALDVAKIALERTKIYAPVSGIVSRKTLEVGQQLSVGQTFLAILPKNVWVVANFKETQMTEVRVGQSAEIEADNLPGRKFSGRVQSLAEGTGATFALLPPDNATGNFTKVVQRVSVKVVFDDAKSANKLLRNGLSALVVIATKDDAKQ